MRSKIVHILDYEWKFVFITDKGKIAYTKYFNPATSLRYWQTKNIITGIRGKKVCH